MNDEEHVALDEKLRHELGNALMVVLTFAELIDREAAEKPHIRLATRHIRDAVFRSRTAVDEVSRELTRLARLLSSSGNGVSNGPQPHA